MATPAGRFSVGINYWPQRSGMAMWSQYDAGEIRDDFAHIAALGLDSVRFFVRWDALQPDAGAVDTAILDRVDDVVTLAEAAGLRVLPALCGTMNGVSYMPSWSKKYADLYRGPLLDAQILVANAVAERLRDRPSVAAWDIGHAFTDVRAPRSGKRSTGDHGSVPVSEQELAEWSRRIAAPLRSASIPVTAGAFSGDVLSDTNVRFGSLCAPLTFASMQGSTVTSFFARNRLDPEAIPFLAMVTAAFSFKPVLITAVGNPTCVDGKFSPFERFALADEPPLWEISPDDPALSSYPCLTEAESAAYATATLERLHADGRLGAYWWCWSDGAADSGAPHDGSFGILRSDGTERPVAAALSAFARQARTVRKPADMPMISSTYYYRTLPASTRTLYDAFLGYIAERRESPAGSMEKT